MKPVRSAVVCVVVGVVLTPFPAAQHYSAWSDPVPLTSLNSSFNDGSATVSKDGRTLYFASNRTGQQDLYVSQWDDAIEDWGSPVTLGEPINTQLSEFAPNLSRDGHWLFYHSNRTGSFTPGVDIWASYREHVHDDFAWQTPVNLGADFNAPGLDISPSFFENDDYGLPQMFFGSNRAGGPPDFYLSEMRADGTFGPPVLIPELNSPGPDAAISVRFDGLEVFFASVRTGGRGGMDIWTATRESVLDPWPTPTNVSELNTDFIDQDPHIAADRETLYFTSNRAGTNDLYKATRTKVQGGR
jgi:hypothetical protein